MLPPISSKPLFFPKGGSSGYHSLSVSRMRIGSISASSDSCPSYPILPYVIGYPSQRMARRWTAAEYFLALSLSRGSFGFKEKEGKLAECQETILVLSKKLKALACLVDYMEFPYEAEKRAERDQRYELDAPWSPCIQSASWASKPKNISTTNGKGRASEWASEFGFAASDLYKVNVLDSPIVDYLDGNLIMHTYSDTEESSPAGSLVKSTEQRNKFTCFSLGSEFPKSIKTYGGESPTSSSSSSSLASTFFSKSRE